MCCFQEWSERVVFDASVHLKARARLLVCGLEMSVPIFKKLDGADREVVPRLTLS
jgi:hypothetical protein